MYNVHGLYIILQEMQYLGKIVLEGEFYVSSVCCVVAAAACVCRPKGWLAVD